MKEIITVGKTAFLKDDDLILFPAILKETLKGISKYNLGSTSHDPSLGINDLNLCFI